MPRVKKPVNYEDELKKLDSKIGQLEKSLKKHKEARKQLTSEKRESELRKLSEFIEKSGKSIEQFIDEIKG